MKQPICATSLTILLNIRDVLLSRVTTAVGSIQKELDAIIFDIVLSCSEAEVLSTIYKYLCHGKQWRQKRLACQGQVPSAS